MLCWCRILKIDAQTGVVQLITSSEALNDEAKWEVGWAGGVQSGWAKCSTYCAVWCCAVGQQSWLALKDPYTAPRIGAVSYPVWPGLSTLSSRLFLLLLF